MVGHRNAHLQIRVAEHVADELRERLLANGFPDNKLPKLDELVEKFGVSAPSLREALRILEAEGLLTVRRGRLGGSEVRRPDATSAGYAIALGLQGQGITIEDLAEAVKKLEPMAVASCAERADRGERLVPLLEENVALCEAALGGSEFTHRSREFHDLVVKFTANATLRMIISSVVAVWSTQEENWAYAVQQSGAYPDIEEQREVLRAHRGILAEIAKGNSLKAEKVARRHIEATQDRVIQDGFGQRMVDATSPAAVKRFRRLKTDFQ